MSGHPSTETGYTHRGYAASLSEFGRPLHLPRSGTWLLVRPIGSTGLHDAMGVYPLTRCRDWTRLGEDLRELARELVSVTLVADPFTAPDRETLRAIFVDHVRPLSDHVVVDCTLPLDVSVSRHHRKYARRALRNLTVQIWDQASIPSGFLDEWLALHAHLVRRHDVQGVRAFSPDAFARQLQLPGVVAVRADRAGELLGAQLWLLDGDVAYGHVLAQSPAGYREGAGYAMYWTALEYLKTRVRYCDIGGVPRGTDTSGLDWFKRGWSSVTKPSWLCGRVLQNDTYQRLNQELGTTSDFFPAYRRH